MERINDRANGAYGVDYVWSELYIRGGRINKGGEGAIYHRYICAGEGAIYHRYICVGEGAIYHRYI